MLKQIVTETTDAVVAAVQGADNILSAVTGTVKHQVINVLQGTGEVASTGIETVASVASGALRGAGQVGASLTDAAGQVVHGAVTGVSQAGGDVIAGEVLVDGRRRVVQVRLSADAGGRVGDVKTATGDRIKIRLDKSHDETPEFDVHPSPETGESVRATASICHLRFCCTGASRAAKAPCSRRRRAPRIPLARRTVAGP